jgi:hypothetical protein
MKVFIGWSGARSQALAVALRDWIPLVLQYVEPWLSEKDIDAGERWAQTIAKELESSNFGIICITRENAASPWIVFEAGSLAKSLEEGRVIPLLLDVEFKEITGPLAQFQAKKVEKGGLYDVIQSVNKAAPQPIPEQRARQLVDALWPELEKLLTSIPKQAASAKPSRPQAEILEELVAGVRSLESRLRESEERLSTMVPRSRRSRRIHPMMLHELTHMISGGPGDPIGVLLVASMVREEMPWLYELGMEAYRAAKIGDSDEAQNALRRFRRAAELMVEGPFAEELGLDPRAIHMITRDLEHFLIPEPSPEEEPRTKRKARSEEKEQ